MSLRQKFEEKIIKKQQEINELESKVRESRAYIQALQDSLKLLPRDDAKPGTDETLLRKGSIVYKAMKIIKATGHPMHVNEILSGIGLTENKKNRVSLGGSLSRYARNGQIFKRTDPNTFSLLSVVNEGEEPPADFGLDNDQQEDDMEAKVPF